MASNWFENATVDDIDALMEVLDVAHELAEPVVAGCWIERLKDLIRCVCDSGGRVRMMTALLKALANAPYPDDLRLLAAEVEDLIPTLGGGRDGERETLQLVQALAAIGEIDRADQIGRSIHSPTGQARALAVVAAHAGPEQAKRLVVEIVRMSDWTVPLTVPAWHSTEVVEVIREQLEVIRGIQPPASPMGT